MHTTIKSCIQPSSAQSILQDRWLLSALHLTFSFLLRYNDFKTTVYFQIRGTSLGISDYSCVFGDYSVGVTEAKHAAPGLLECLIPPAPINETSGFPITGPTSLHVVSAVGFASNRLRFTFYTPPTLLGVVPAFGSMEGGTRVVATGIGFADLVGGVACSFGGVETPGKVLSASKVVCTSPAAVIGGVGVGNEDEALHFVPFLVTLNGQHYTGGQQSTEIQVAFEYTDVPVVSFISPISGPPDVNSGGDARGEDRMGPYITARGAHFREGTGLACRFGTLPTVAVFLSPSEVRCLIPPMSSATGGAPNVAVTANGVDFSREGPPSVTFTYVARPTLVGIAPDLGPSTGGSTITVIGENLDPGMIEPVRQASLICRFEMEDAGVSDLNDDVSPSGNPARTLVFDVAATVESDSAATCVSPAVAGSITSVSGGGYATVRVSADGGSSFSTSESTFFYYPNTEVFSVTPVTVPAFNGGDIIVSGQGFLPAGGLLLCLYESAAAVSIYDDPSRVAEDNPVVRTEGNNYTFTTVAVWLSSELVRCELPALDVEAGTSSALAVRVINNGVDPSPSAAHLLAYASPELSSIDPASGPRTGGTPVTLTVDGWGLPATMGVEISCQWGGNVSTEGVLSSVAGDAQAANHRVYVSCASPLTSMALPTSSSQEIVASSDTSIVEVTLLVDSQEVSDSGAGLPFTFYDAPIILNASPPAGGKLGGTDVVIKGSGFTFGTPGNAGSGQTVCKFGEYATVSAAVVSDAELRCRSPPFVGENVSSAAGESVDVKISMNGGVDYSWSASVSFQVLPIASTTGENHAHLLLPDTLQSRV